MHHHLITKILKEEATLPNKQDSKRKCNQDSKRRCYETFPSKSKIILSRKSNYDRLLILDTFSML
jgi:hypothetical protein